MLEAVEEEHEDKPFFGENSHEADIVKSVSEIPAFVGGCVLALGIGAILLAGATRIVKFAWGK